MHEFEFISALCDGDYRVYRHTFFGSDGSRWVTEPSSREHRIRILRKGDRYYAVSGSYAALFAREYSYKVVVEIPARHRIVSAFDAGGERILIDPDDSAKQEFDQWNNDDSNDAWLTLNIENFFGQ